MSQENGRCSINVGDISGEIPLGVAALVIVISTVGSVELLTYFFRPNSLLCVESAVALRKITGTTHPAKTHVGFGYAVPCNWSRLMRRFVLALALCSGTLAFGNVTVSAPANGSTVSTTVQYVASATTGCAAGVSAIGIYTAPGALAYSTSGSSLNTKLSLSPGTYQTVVQSWDNCGDSSNRRPSPLRVSARAPLRCKSLRPPITPT